ncbi:MAG: hypothetical protein K0V04_22020 [Deltaproteobacteria bacterium]|nr:hypothetical protein [Deltaproteobacteria bacterium]
MNITALTASTALFTLALAAAPLTAQACPPQQCASASWQARSTIVHVGTPFHYDETLYLSETRHFPGLRRRAWARCGWPRAIPPRRSASWSGR